MRRLPREVDELMWEVAERNDPAAIDAFGARYPEFRPELVKRLQLVRGLRRARPAGPVRRFVPSPNPAWWRTRSAVSTAAGAVLALGVVFALYGVGVAIAHSRPPVAPAPQPSVSNPAPISTPFAPEETPRVALAPQPEERPRPAPSQPEPEAPNYFERPVTVVSNRTTLHEALSEVARQAHLDLQVAPGTPDPVIVMQYENQSAISVLKDMGKTFGFTPLVQSERSAIIVPAVDPHAATEAEPPGTNDLRAPEKAPGHSATLEGPISKR